MKRTNNKSQKRGNNNNKRESKGPKVTAIVAVVSIGCLLVQQYKNNEYIVSQSLLSQSLFSGDDTAPKTKSTTTTRGGLPRTGPFPMPQKGAAYDIFQPLYDLPESVKDQPIFASPSEMIQTFEKRIQWADSMVQPLTQGMSTKDHATQMYVETIKNFVSGVVYGSAEYSVPPGLSTKGKRLSASQLDVNVRRGGNDWTYAGDTMTGFLRLDNVYQLLKDVTSNNIAGDYIETGVWRGGSSVFAKAVMSALEVGKSHTNSRVSYVCDSFHGLPPGDRSLDKQDKGWDNTQYLEVPAEIVANNFIKYNLLDSNVVFARGFFNETMPPLSKVVKKLAIMRLDGDMYESTVDVLYNLYDKLSIGGYVIMDDWFGFPSKVACEDFFAVHGIQPEIVKVDDLAAYWKKTEEVDIQYWRYEQNKFKKE